MGKKIFFFSFFSPLFFIETKNQKNGKTRNVLGDDLVIIGASRSIQFDQHSIVDLLSNRPYTSGRKCTTFISSPLKVDSPLPSFFQNETKTGSQEQTMDIGSLTYLSNNKGLKNYFEKMVEDWLKMEENVGSTFQLQRYSKSDFPELKNDLMSYLDNYS